MASEMVKCFADSNVSFNSGHYTAVTKRHFLYINSCRTVCTLHGNSADTVCQCNQSQKFARWCVWGTLTRHSWLQGSTHCSSLAFLNLSSFDFQPAIASRLFHSCVFHHLFWPSSFFHSRVFSRPLPRPAGRLIWACFLIYWELSPPLILVYVGKKGLFLAPWLGILNTFGFSLQLALLVPPGLTPQVLRGKTPRTLTPSSPEKCPMSPPSVASKEWWDGY